MPDVTREQALAAARLVYGPGAYVDEIPGDLGWEAGALPVRWPTAGRYHRSGSTLRELVDEMADEYASGCRREAESWFATGGRCVAAAMLSDDLSGEATIGAFQIGRLLAQVQVWVADAEARVYRSAGLREPRPSDAPSEQDR